MNHPTLFHIIYYLILLFLSIHRRADLIWALIISSISDLKLHNLASLFWLPSLETSRSKILQVFLTGIYWSVVFLFWSLILFLSYHMKKPCIFHSQGLSSCSFQSLFTSWQKNLSMQWGQTSLFIYFIFLWSCLSLFPRLCFIHFNLFFF